MADLDEQLDRACADGRITAHDADEVRNFASFLTVVQGVPTRSTEATPEQSSRFLAAWREHYPDDYDQAVAEAQARRGKERTDS